MTLVPGETNFKQALAKLNPSQREAVDTIEGPVMVIAGPGTGKTQILTLRIANILRLTDTKPEQILALTFTDSGARAMRKRLVSFVGAAAYQVPIHTFHSFAGLLIAEYPASYSNIVGGRPATDLEKINLIETILEATSYKALRPVGDPSYYVKPILEAIATLKKENVSADDLSLQIVKQLASLDQIEKLHSKGAHKGKVRGEYQEAEKYLLRNQELLQIYRTYLAMIKAEKLFDFEDMILDSLQALRSNEDMLRDVQERFQYVLADEHQDVNQSQNALIELIAAYHDRPNIFAVGDEKQAIYRFQGASLDNFLYFEDRFPEAKIISLTNNYRSLQPILDLAQAVIETDDELLAPLRVPLKAVNAGVLRLERAEFSHPGIENDWLVEEVVKLHKSGLPLSEIAVIVRTNREVEELAGLFRKASVAVNPSADGNLLKHPLLAHIMLLMSAYAEEVNEETLANLLYAPYWNILSADRFKILQARSYRQPLRLIISDSTILSELEVTEPDRILAIGKTLESARAQSLSKTSTEVLEILLKESGFLDYVMKSEPELGSRLVRRLYDEVETMVAKHEVENLNDVLGLLRLYQAHSIPLRAKEILVDPEAVSVMTAHKAKGLEFSTVFLPHLTDSLWGGSVRSSLFNLPITKHDFDPKLAAEDDEKRLFYVALTRAKATLICTTSAVNKEGKQQSPSRLLLDLPEGVINEVNVAATTAAFEPLKILTPVASNSTLSALLLRQSLNDRGWSATAFNNYCQSPWQYIYRNVLRFPALKSVSLQYGSALHAVLDQVVKRVKLGQPVNDSFVAETLAMVLSKYPISTTDYTRLHERGLVALINYIETLEQINLKSSYSEYSVNSILPTGWAEFPEVILTGNLDRLDFDDEAVLLRVIDYKSGKPKTRNEIEGKTKTSTGSYKRQLVFYALLLSLHPDPKWHCRTGTLAFVEPDKKGVLHEETFTITDEEIDSLRADIIDATKAVVTGSCLEVSCDPEVCDYCHLLN